MREPEHILKSFSIGYALLIRASYFVHISISGKLRNHSKPNDCWSFF